MGCLCGNRFFPLNRFLYVEIDLDDDSEEEKSPLVDQEDSEEENSESQERLKSEQTDLFELKRVEVQEENGQSDSDPLKPSFGYVGQ